MDVPRKRLEDIINQLSVVAANGAPTTEPGATAAELLAFADRIVATVQQKFGVTLEREPTAV